ENGPNEGLAARPWNSNAASPLTIRNPPYDGLSLYQEDASGATAMASVRHPGPLSDLRCSSPRAPLSTKPGLVHQRERAVGPIRGPLHRRRRRGGVFDVVVPPRGLWRAHPLGSGGQDAFAVPGQGTTLSAMRLQRLAHHAPDARQA